MRMKTADPTRTQVKARHKDAHLHSPCFVRKWINVGAHQTTIGIQMRNVHLCAQVTAE